MVNGNREFTLRKPPQQKEGEKNRRSFVDSPELSVVVADNKPKQENEKQKKKGRERESRKSHWSHYNLEIITFEPECVPFVLAIKLVESLSLSLFHAVHRYYRHSCGTVIITGHRESKRFALPKRLSSGSFYLISLMISVVIFFACFHITMSS